MQASVVATHGLSCPAAFGICPDQGLNPCLLRWQVDSLLPRATREAQVVTVLLSSTTKFYFVVISKVDREMDQISQLVATA